MVAGIVPFGSSRRVDAWRERGNRVALRRHGRHHRIHGYRDRADSAGRWDRPRCGFVYPEHALYVFGPEDGSLGRATLAQCHRFLVIPTRHCANLSAAVYTVLYDRDAKRVQEGLELPHSTAGDFDEPDHMADAVGVTWGG